MATYTPFTSTSQIRVYPNDWKFRVFYLEAPLSILAQTVGAEFGNDVLNINGFHTGIGFQALNESEEVVPNASFTFDLTAANGLVLQALLPSVVTSPSGERSLQWNNPAQINLGSAIDMSYWVKSTYIFTIITMDLLLAQRWVLEEWIPNNPLYALFSASVSPFKSDIFNPYMRGCICDTFAYNLLHFINGTQAGELKSPVDPTPGLKIPFENVTIPNLTVASFIGAPNTQVSVVDFESEKDQIINFFQELARLLDREYHLLERIERAIGGILEQNLENSNNLIRQLQNELYTIIHIARRLYCRFQTSYYYSYDVRDGQLKYWKILQPMLYIAYLNSSLGTTTYSEALVNSLGRQPADLRKGICIPPKRVTSDVSWVRILIPLGVVILVLLVYFSARPYLR